MTDPREPQEPIQEGQELSESVTDDEVTEQTTDLEEVLETDEALEPGAGSTTEAPDEPVDTFALPPAQPVPSIAATPEPAGRAAASSQAGKPTSGRSATGTGDAVEMPYVDDPVSKWWVGIIIAVFTLIFLWAIFLGDAFDGLFEGREPTAAPSPSPVASASLIATASPQAATVAPTQAATARATGDLATPRPTLAPATAAPATTAPATQTPATLAPSAVATIPLATASTAG